MLKIGMVSTAHLHADSYAVQVRGPLAGEAALVGLWDDDAARRAIKAAEYGAAEYAELDALLADVDAVVVCSENVRHRPLVEKAATGRATPAHRRGSSRCARAHWRRSPRAMASRRGVPSRACWCPRESH